MPVGTDSVICPDFGTEPCSEAVGGRKIVRRAGELRAIPLPSRLAGAVSFSGSMRGIGSRWPRRVAVLCKQLRRVDCLFPLLPLAKSRQGRSWHFCAGARHLSVYYHASDESWSGGGPDVGFALTFFGYTAREILPSACRTATVKDASYRIDDCNRNGERRDLNCTAGGAGVA